MITEKSQSGVDFPALALMIEAIYQTRAQCGGARSLASMTESTNGRLEAIELRARSPASQADHREKPLFAMMKFPTSAINCISNAVPRHLRGCLQVDIASINTDFRQLCSALGEIVGKTKKRELPNSERITIF